MAVALLAGLFPSPLAWGAGKEFHAPPDLPPAAVQAPPSAPWLNASATELVRNGGFEQGLSFWNTWIQPGSMGDWFYSSGNVTPQSGLLIPGPPIGTRQGIADMVGPGTEILYQDVAIPPLASAELNLIIWYRNVADSFANAPGLDYTISPNQQFRIDIMDPEAPEIDTGSGVLLNVFQTDPSMPLMQPYMALNANLDQFAGQTIRIRLAVAANLYFCPVGVDAVSILAEVPVPATATSWGMAKARYRR
jgi:hypothetical protein